MKRFSLKVFTRYWHRQLMWLIGLQLLFWSATGLYMVSIDIHTIHGDHVTLPAQSLDMPQVKISHSQILEILNQTTDSLPIKHISLRMLPLSSPLSPSLAA